ncbi:bifunctional pyr operon transcriptional regulator/uracil phosphoribosyltransferase PyrR [Rhabdochromatium marinum]|uniref:bifunctional pyr operon transcriptional regulator/uracil phosphoribosyltransferase PyrR n=1 Tax=Rhabdochromatium marinum TaxID=48729 RepID=UPI00190448EA|nr:bifunctional pyr operon transcriptional regulator/uracil phosphoribosyltransferase PyrR [Rhabdochromatium marinum]MBK1649427.1 bifunctional pyr operon transcriptional regulator/uracil phosphoribosyltransferase [Rhabdochromatium marinum]
MPTADIIQPAAQIEATIANMAEALNHLCQQHGIEQPLMIGIHTGGVWVARHLHRRLGLEEPLGFLDISFYRDDFTHIGLHPQVHPSELPVAVDDRAVILVDDVLQSGRTVRAALNVLFDYGRPSLVLLAILAQRDGRELPITPDVVGLHVNLERGAHIKLNGPDPLYLEQRATAPGTPS